VVHAHLTCEYRVSPECAHWLEATSRWTSQLHHFEFLPTERVRALLVANADVHAGDAGVDAPTPLSLAAARLLSDSGFDDGRAALIASAAGPSSPTTHALFPAGAKARAIELVQLGWLLARHLQDLIADGTEAEVAFRDAWLGHVMPHAIQRSSSSGVALAGPSANRLTRLRSWLKARRGSLNDQPSSRGLTVQTGGWRVIDAVRYLGLMSTLNFRTLHPCYAWKAIQESAASARTTTTTRMRTMSSRCSAIRRPSLRAVVHPLPSSSVAPARRAAPSR
jgi:hypothetical protein